jgi:MFS family permease
MLTHVPKACFLSPAVAPLIGGVVAHYSSWRYVQLATGISAAINFIAMYYFLPETSQPNARGIDKLSENENRSEFKWVWLNPFRDLALLRSPTILSVVRFNYTSLPTTLGY